jgi:hypothetical protein
LHGNEGDGFRVIESEAAGEAVLREASGLVEAQVIQLAGA